MCCKKIMSKLMISNHSIPKTKYHKNIHPSTNLKPKYFTFAFIWYIIIHQLFILNIINMADTIARKWTRYGAFSPRQVLYAAGMKRQWILLLISMIIPLLNILLIIIFFFVGWFKGADWIKNSPNYTDEQKDGIIWYFNSLQTVFMVLFILTLVFLVVYAVFMGSIIAWSWALEMMWWAWWLDPAMLEALGGIEGIQWLEWLEGFEALGEVADGAQ